MSRSKRQLLKPALLLTLVLAGQAGAQAPQSLPQGPLLRDPMQPPAALRAPAASGAITSAPALPESAQVLITEGKAYALIGSRRYAQGARIGSGPEALTVERVNEHGVWLRSREGLHALPMVSGVNRTPSPESGSPDKSQEKRDRP
ncbi:hypothetical protein H5407_14490 [Mitsuaria sp. WAJ17]|uniref:hypothetical protein n=1 Tax=Mitsuaria sp. WAJ17 TaxID=2761452 RepID=UPI0016004F23|nr:hypothetical protein [Mitsuaria sp. WAJ17]MBB2486430.1 hypothetical protein [Mitsuaria sp. WAJ17]